MSAIEPMKQSKKNLVPQNKFLDVQIQLISLIKDIKIVEESQLDKSWSTNLLMQGEASMEAHNSVWIVAIFKDISLMDILWRCD